MLVVIGVREAQSAGCRFSWSSKARLEVHACARAALCRDTGEGGGA